MARPQLEQILGKKDAGEIFGKPFGINPDSRYDKKTLLEKAGELFAVEQCYGEIGKNGSNTAAVNQLIKIALKYMPGDKAKDAEILRNSYHAFTASGILLKTGQEKMAEFARTNQKYIFDAIPKKDLSDMAIDMPDEDKKYLDVAIPLEREDFNSARKAFADLYQNKVWKNWVERMEKDHAETYMKLYAGSQREIFANENLKDEVTEKGKKTYKLNSEKVRSYLAKTLAKYDEQDRAKFYLDLIKVVYAQNKQN